jgi:hypothetical protein
MPKKISIQQRIQQYFKKSPNQITKKIPKDTTNSTKHIASTPPKVWVRTPEQIIADQKAAQALQEYIQLKREYENSMANRTHQVKPLGF